MDTEVTGVSESANSELKSTPTQISQVAHHAPSPPALKTSASSDSKPVPIEEPARFLERDSTPLPTSPYPPSSNSNSLPTARINAVGSRIATVYSSGNNRTTSKIYGSSTHTDPAIHENTTDTVRSEPRVTAYADHVLVGNSGNDVIGTQTTNWRETPGTNMNDSEVILGKFLIILITWNYKLNFFFLEHLRTVSSQNKLHDSGV